MVTNGTGMSPTQTPNLESNNDAKKVKLEIQAAKPSRVLHLRGVPSDATESEIIQLGLPFGRMTNLVLAKKKNQALLEMADINTATTMANYYTEHKPQIRGRTIYIQFSNHEQLKTESSSQNAGAQAALQAAQQLMGSMEEPKVVLRVIIEHMMYPVTIDVLKQIFSRYGQVLRIVTFNKNNTFQALIEYSDPIAAQTAKVSLNSQNIYNGCCTLRIDFSKLTTLNVKYNNDKSRDYTNPNLPSGEGTLPMDAALSYGAAAAAAGAHGVFASPFAMPGLGTTLTAYGAAPPGAGMGALQAIPFNLAGMPTAMGPAGMRFPGQPHTGAVLLVSNLNEQVYSFATS